LKLIHAAVLRERSQQAEWRACRQRFFHRECPIYMAISASECARAEKKYPLVETRQRSENRNIMNDSILMNTEVCCSQRQSNGSAGTCSQQMKDGKAVPLTESDRLAIAIENDRMAGKALRLLGVAYTLINDTEAALNLRKPDLVGFDWDGRPDQKGVKQLMHAFIRLALIQ